MNIEAKEEIKKFIATYKVNDGLLVAELGSYNINGSVKEIIPYLCGFDILPGKDVDVVIDPGKIPNDHYHKYDVLISTGSFQTCPDSKMYKQEILDLCKIGATLLLTACSNDCTCQHSTSPNQYNFKDGVRMSMEELIAFLSPEIIKLECYTVKVAHSTIIFIGRIM